jgi:hypothetical protein
MTLISFYHFFSFKILCEYQEDRLKLAYKHENMSFLFADICHFTPWAKRTEAKEVTTLSYVLFEFFHLLRLSDYCNNFLTNSIITHRVLVYLNYVLLAMHILLLPNPLLQTKFLVRLQHMVVNVFYKWQKL